MESTPHWSQQAVREYEERIARNRPSPGSTFCLIPGDGFTARRSDVLCAYCAKPVGLRTTIVVTPSERWAHERCHETYGADLYPKENTDD